jgi:hypothetical protein
MKSVKTGANYFENYEGVTDHPLKWTKPKRLFLYGLKLYVGLRLKFEL